MKLILMICLLVLATGCVTTEQTEEIDIVSRNFEFEPNIIEVNHGDNVILKLTSEDVPHGFGIAEFGISTTIPPNDEITVNFKADKKGEFKIFCTVFCGVGHPDHKGVLVVK